MKKLVSLMLCLAFGSMVAAYAAKPVNKQVYNGIAQYKKGNYTGCIQTMEGVLKKNPNDILAKYYMALVYTKIGMKQEAKDYYQKVVDQGSEKVLVKYSQKALVCLDKPTDKVCTGKGNNEKDDDMDLFVKSGEFLHPDLKKRIQERELNDVKNVFNNNKTPDLNDYRFINDASDEIPTDAEIAAAVKVLAKVGYNPVANFQNSQMSQLNLLNGQNSNSFADMLPYIMTQGNNKNGSMSPELIQAMLMNQSMNGFDFTSRN